MKVDVSCSFPQSVVSHVKITAGGGCGATDQSSKQRPGGGGTKRGSIEDPAQQIGDKRKRDQGNWKMDQSRMKRRHRLLPFSPNRPRKPHANDVERV